MSIPPTQFEIDMKCLEAEILDLEMCLAANPLSKKWQEIKFTCDQKKKRFAAQKRLLHTPGPRVSVTGEQRW